MANAALGFDTDPEDTSWLELFDFVICEAGKARVLRQPRPARR